MQLADAGYLTNMKLQKLFYYAQGVFLGMTGNRLFIDDIEVWTYGSVVATIYQKYNCYGKHGAEYR